MLLFDAVRLGDRGSAAFTTLASIPRNIDYCTKQAMNAHCGGIVPNKLDNLSSQPLKVKCYLVLRGCWAASVIVCCHLGQGSRVAVNGKAAWLTRQYQKWQDICLLVARATWPPNNERVDRSVPEKDLLQPNKQTYRL
jgi:hypothetical protein